MTELLTAALGHPIVGRLAFVLAHFLWQGALILSLALILRNLTRSVHTRYTVGVGALAATALAPVFTYLLSANQSNRGSSGSADFALGLVADVPGLNGSGTYSTTTDWQPVVVLLWMVGVALLALRTSGGWLRLRRLRLSAHGPEAQGAEILERCARRLGIRTPRLLCSAAAVGPVLIGWFRPVILLPVSIATGVPPAHVESLLLHELMHLRRRDHLVNLGQVLLETLLFYHPAVWYLSALVRSDREHCCDASTAHEIGDPRAYARALLLAEEQRQAATATLALAATGPRLLDRIRRLTAGSHDDGSRSPSVSLLAGGLAMTALCGLLLVACQREALKPMIVSTPPPASGPRTSPVASIWVVSDSEVRVVLPQRDMVTLDAFDASGARVRRLVTDTLAAGMHLVRWDARGDDGSDLPLGAYFIRLVSGETNRIVKIVNGPVDDTAAWPTHLVPGRLAPLAIASPLYATGDSTLFRTVRLSKGFPRLQFVLDDTSDVVIDVIDQSGDVIRDLLDRNLAPGEYHAVWDGKNNLGHVVPDGLYAGQLSVNGELTASILNWRLERAE